MSTIGLAIMLRSITAIIWGAMAIPITVDVSRPVSLGAGNESFDSAGHDRRTAVSTCIAMTAFFRLTRMGPPTRYSEQRVNGPIAGDQGWQHSPAGMDWVGNHCGPDRI